MPQKVPFDTASYIAQIRAQKACFICEIISGTQTDEHIVFRDDVCITFFTRFPTLKGYTLVAPLEHRTDVVAGFTEDEYVAMQRRVQRVGRAIHACVPTERLYVCSLGSHQGNAHVHWHLAPLPSGVPYEEQQFAAMMLENRYLDLRPDELGDLAARMRAVLEA